MLNTDKFKNKTALPVIQSRKGFSMTEMAISTIILAIIMIGAAGFSTGFFNVSATSSVQLLNVNQSRELGQNITNEITNSRYIYPPGTTISLSTTHPVTGAGWDFTINTNDSAAMLFSENLNNDANVTYGFVAYFLSDEDDGSTTCYQFIDSPSYQWAQNTSPASDLLSFSGNVSVIISDVERNNTTLNYIFNYNNGITDKILQGEISGVAINDSNALIKGIDWQIAQNNIEAQTVRIKGLSKNVPRFIE